MEQKSNGGGVDERARDHHAMTPGSSRAGNVYLSQRTQDQLDELWEANRRLWNAVHAATPQGRGSRFF